MTPALEVKGLSIKFGDFTAVDDVSFRVEKGEIFGFLGANGAGKTTTLMSISGVTPPRKGAIRFLGEDITRLSTERIVSLGITQVPEGRMIFPRLTVKENLLMGGYLRRDKAELRADEEKVYNLFPVLKERRTQMGGTLSGGEQQMLAIGRALVTNPRLLILDEATEGLAPLIRDEIWACLAQLRSAGQSVLVVDKYVEKLIALADRHTIIERGTVVWQGSSSALDADHGIWHRYLGI